MTPNYPNCFSWTMSYEDLDDSIMARLTMLRNMNDAESYYSTRSEFTGMDYVDVVCLTAIIDRYVINTELTEITDTYIQLYREVSPDIKGLCDDRVMYAYTILPVILDIAKQEYYARIRDILPEGNYDVVFLDFKFSLRKLFILVKVM